mgnify:CR=1 FL=1
MTRRVPDADKNPLLLSAIEAHLTDFHPVNRLGTAQPPVYLKRNAAKVHLFFATLFLTQIKRFTPTCWNHSLPYWNLQVARRANDQTKTRWRILDLVVQERYVCASTKINYPIHLCMDNSQVKMLPGSCSDSRWSSLPGNKFFCFAPEIAFHLSNRYRRVGGMGANISKAERKKLCGKVAKLPRNTLHSGWQQ